MAETSQASPQYDFIVGQVVVKNLEKVSWRHKSIEEEIRKKLAEFASELESFKTLRDSD